MVGKLSVAVGAAILLTACSSSTGGHPSAPANLTSGASGRSVSAAPNLGVSNAAIFCRGIHMEQTQQDDKQDLAALRETLAGTNGSLRFDVLRIIAAFKNGHEDAQWRAAVARLRAAAIATCHADPMQQSTHIPAAPAGTPSASPSPS